MSRPSLKPPAAPIYVEVALPIPLRQTFTYRLSKEIANSILPGSRLTVPFGKRTLTGFAVQFHDDLPAETDLKEQAVKNAIELVDDKPLITEEILRLTQWTADYYMASWGEMLKAALPAGIDPLRETRVKPKRRKGVRLIGAPDDADKLTDLQKRTVEVLRQHGGEMLFTTLQEKADVGGSTINTLTKRRIIEVYVVEVLRDPMPDTLPPRTEEFALSEEQATALARIENSLGENKYRTFLLHGVTGSGKTEIYIRAMKSALAKGGSAMMLVPEIALTPVFARHLRAVFGAELAILHSNLSPGERFDEWRRIRRGDARIVIGTRSAVFAPLENIGLLIVDEEHDSSYRQHESPFYHARDVAIMRANFAGATVVLGSATPAMESFHNARCRKYEYLSLPNRIGDRPMATAKIVDMREVFRKAGKDIAFSPQLLEAIEQTHSKGEQSIVLLNRRGFSQFVLCRSCGETLRCKNCDITLTYHKRESRLICHYCNYRVAVPDVCPFCKSEYLYFVGEGTEQLEVILKKRFPNLRIARIDRDTMSRRRDLEQILLAFSRHEIDMLVGTQMLAKGHDFPNVTLVGVVSVDLGLGLPDLRSAERTFQLLTQVAGRSGRGNLPGQVLIQTYYPEHYAIRHARSQDYSGFYEEEIRYRERLGYPPFFALASILVHHKDQKHVAKTAQILRMSLDAANPNRSIRITGPAPASLSRLKGEHRVQILVRSANRKELRGILDMAMSAAKELSADMRIVSIEIDPISML
jgi:primosomal protein N' (replication factor Y)